MVKEGFSVVCYSANHPAVCNIGQESYKQFDGKPMTCSPNVASVCPVGYACTFSAGGKYYCCRNKAVGGVQGETIFEC